MKKNLIIKEYKSKIKLIQRYNDYYYDKDKPIVSDEEYDELKKKNYTVRK